MLDSGGNESRGGQILSTSTDFSQKGLLIADPRPEGHIQAVSKKNTVKELLMMRRQAHRSEQIWTCSQDDDKPERQVKTAKCEASDASPHLFGPPALVNPICTAHFPPPPPPLPPAALENAAPQQMQNPPVYTALQGREAAPPPTTSGVELTLFHWQIRREAQKADGLSPELLGMQDADGDTFLHIAVAKGRRALAYVLAAKMTGCGSLDVKEHNGQTALQIAAATNQHLIVRDLLAHGAQIDTRDSWGRSPLHVCAQKGHLSSLQSIWKTVAGSGQHIDIEVFNYDGLTPLHAAVLSHNAVVKEARSLENPCVYMTKELAQRRRMYAECIRTLLLMGASCGTRDLKSGRTCLHMASEQANVELLNVFLDQPASLFIVNVKTFSGNTALHIVCSLQSHKSQVEAAKLLMRRGADPGARNFENELPSQLVPEGPVGKEVRQILKGKHIYA